MTKGEFYMILNECFQNSSVTEINEKLRGIKYLRWCWEYLDRVNVGYVECKSCGEFVRTCECQINEYKVDHLFGTKLKKEYICPICGEVAGKVPEKEEKQYKTEDTKAKEEFFQFLDKFFEHKRVTEINETLRKLDFYSWRDDYLEKRNEGYIKCKHCKQYVPVVDCNRVKETYSILIGIREEEKYICPLCKDVAYRSFYTY